MVNSLTGVLGHVGIGLTYGLVVMVMIAATGRLSGAHFNPAVTIAFAVTRHFAGREVPVYIGGQIGGNSGRAYLPIYPCPHRGAGADSGRRQIRSRPSEW